MSSAEFQFYKNKFLVFGVCLASLLALTEMPYWISLFVVLCFIGRLCIDKKWIKPFSTLTIASLGLILFTIVLIQYRSLFGQLESGILIVGLTGVSVLNYSKERDRKLVTLLSFILVIMKSMFAPEIYWLALSIVAFGLLWISMLKEFTAQTEMLFKLFIKAIPLTVLLYLVFPRIVLYQNQKYQQSFATTGFSEQLRPGQIAQIVQDDSLAFYVHFDSEDKNLPALAQDRLYWRGGVLTESHGLMWKSKPVLLNPVSSLDVNINPDVKYQMYFEPRRGNYLFTLDAPTRVLASDKQIQKNSENIFRIREWRSSQTVVYFESESEGVLTSSLKLDSNLTENYVNWEESPLTFKWLQDRRRQGLSEDQKMRALSELFKRSGLKYSFQPGFYSQSAFDELLFNRKVGFCEHFAAAYAALARELGLTARVVVGYQGGSYNSMGQFWKITQKEAHAWVEVLQNKIWTRVDPTSWIAPLRLQLSSSEYMQLNESQLSLSYNEYLKIKNQNFFLDGWLHVTSLVENMNYLWSTFVVDFDLNTQLDFLSKFFSLSQKGHTITKYAIYIFLSVFFIYWLRFIRRQKKIILNRPHYLLRQAATSLQIPIKDCMTGCEIIRELKLKFPEFNDFKIQLAYDSEVYLKHRSQNKNFEKSLKTELKKLSTQQSQPTTY